MLNKLFVCNSGYISDYEVIRKNIYFYFCVEMLIIFNVIVWSDPYTSAMFLL